MRRNVLAVNAIKAACGGKPTLTPEAAQALIQAVRRPAETPGCVLTEREKEMLALMLQGLTNNQIAEKLVGRFSTAKFHASSVRTKLTAASQTEAVAIALQNHFIKSPKRLPKDIET